MNIRLFVGLLILATLCSCSLQPRKQEPISGHIDVGDSLDSAQSIPEPVSSIPVIPPPRASADEEVYTVVVNDVPAKELLFALARDAKINVDIHPNIEGIVTINAIDQSLDQILDRVKRQIDIRYRLIGSTLIVEPDLPYSKIYSVGYLNIERESEAESSISTEVGSTGIGDVGGSGGGGGSAGNNSSTQISTKSIHEFWPRIIANIQAIVGSEKQRDIEKEQKSAGSEEASAEAASEEENRDVVANPESGIISVFARDHVHDDVQRFLDAVLHRARRQVLIEATIVEVTLDNDHQTGVDWTAVIDRATSPITFTQNTIGTNLGQPPFTSLSFDGTDLDGAIRALDEFGTTKVLSSPKIMAINNQSALLKVVDNRVYFTLEVETTIDEGVSNTTVEAEIHTVPIGLVMSVTPQVSDNDEIILNVRPTISRILGFVTVPGLAAADVGLESQVPEVQVREMESVLKIHDGKVAVIGGLMQDVSEDNSAGVPGLSRVPGLGTAFGYKTKKFTKSELVVFLRPRLIRDASVTADLRDYQTYLPANIGITNPVPRYFDSGF